jgi:hypothetical protein
MSNPAFEYLRQFKQVNEATEELVLKTLKRKYPNITLEELTNIFERGISGDFGKVYAIDPQTLLGWVDDSQSKVQNGSTYFESPLLDSSIKITDGRYPDTKGWLQEANKCYLAYCRGVSVYDFHPHVYDRLVMDNKVPTSYFEKHMPKTNSIRESKQISLGEFFEWCKSNGVNQIYNV